MTASKPETAPETRPATLLDAAMSVLTTAAPEAKHATSIQADRLRAAGAPLGNSVAPPDLPALPARPPLVHPTDVPRRRLGSAAGRAALLHAVAHIEFNAINLAFDMAARFSAEIGAAGLDSHAFVRDWVRIGGEEARHFALLTRRLEAFNCAYGDLPAHNGLWEAADKTRHSALSRLAIAPLILEARGLDVTPEMIDRLRAVGDEESIAALEVIYAEEIGHVACGKRWFDKLCHAEGLVPEQEFHRLRRAHFAGGLKPPFNHDARKEAGLPRSFYEPIGNEKAAI